MKPFMREHFERFSELVECLWENRHNFSDGHTVEFSIPPYVITPLTPDFLAYLEANVYTIADCKTRRKVFHVVWNMWDVK